MCGSFLPFSRLDSFRVALHAETGLPGSAARRSGLCERALALASPVPMGHGQCEDPDDVPFKKESP